jgi:hypothetical protein
VPVTPAEAAKFTHDSPWALVDGVIVPGTRPLDQVRAQQVQALRSACSRTILAGYVSAALGAPHSYPAQPIDQSNMIASVTASLIPSLPSGWTTPYWCADGAGVWAMRAHTAEQIQRAGSDGKAAIVIAQLRLADLTTQVMAATTADAVAAVVW